MQPGFYSQFGYDISEAYHDKGLKTIYQWGVCTGRSMIETTRYFKHSDIKIDKHFGFDTFTGMPDETAEQVDQESWLKGGLNASEFLGVSSVDECIKTIYDQLVNIDSTTQFHLIPGLAEETINDENNKKYGFTPALIIDADFDIYSPTKFALDYFIKNGIIVEGTIIYYDDWGGVKGWENMEKGEARAHKEICDAYNIEFNFLGQIGNSFPHVQRLYQVTKVNL